MTQSPRSVTSNQQGCHEQLESVVRKHLQTPFRKPYAPHNEQAFAEAQRWLETQQGKPLILDSFCGTGESTAHLARQFPGHAVIGVDKSAHRLGKHESLEGAGRADNYLLLRADTDDFWRLALDAGWQPEFHFILYPNPWPKAAQLMRRCHGSPLFPALLALGGTLELRSNWKTYVDEFVLALEQAGHSSTTEPYTAEPAVTAFERKYQQAGQDLWRCICALSSPATRAL